MTEAENTPAAAHPSPLAGLGIVAIVVAAIVGWAIIGSALFSEVSLFGGFLMLWHWANLEQLEIGKLPSALAGALVGIALAWQVVYLTQTMGGTGTIVGLLVMIAAIYLQIIGFVPFLFNASAMLYLTVAAAPLIQLHIDFVELGLATVVGGLFFGGYVEAVKRIAAMFAPKA